MSEQLTCFPAISNKHAKILILGSMPGKRSLEMQQYYAHPQNQFWPIMAELLGFPNNLEYKERTQQLLKHQVALWDVLQNCHRQSSLDSDIKPDTIVPNDFRLFLKEHTNIRAILFNGKKSEEIFNHRVKKTLDSDRYLEYLPMPSTSPAHASISRKEKIRRWSVLLDYLK